MSDRAQVRNAADPQQVRRAARIERDRAERDLATFVDVLNTPSGREFVERWLDRLGLHTATFDPHGSISNFKQGRHNAALELFAEAQRAGEEAERLSGINTYELLEREARERRRRLNTATDAAHTKPAADTDKGDQHGERE